MTLPDEYIELARQVSTSIQIPKVSSIHLPAIVDDVEKPDEFGFVFLQDGSAGPFYTSLNETLQQLWQLYPEGIVIESNVLDLIEQLTDDSPALNAVALGTFNALSQHVMSRAGFLPTEAGNMGLSKPQAGQTIGMVGFFRPLIEKLISQEVNVLVLEKNPDRVDIQDGIKLSTNPADLANCEQILCTASTLINGTLDGLLDVCSQSTSFSLIGPSGSGLPDILLQHGVDSVGGFYVNDQTALLDALQKQESWGHAGKKYQLTPDNYPGISQLLKQIKD
ncbi:MAG: hypothetical protein HOM14_20480 [Gammaproteobacteria bacterium]|jgi:uncharacterized protein (DUF4213/DUF364 family)|nr:hypothetical protein [Gammaproteobacteria bacterium]MBT3724879.1 hypothetical protein [Gammaproteobacteria bacterium]MBT4076295.1 hypothetical protein [Gammaproteobacteria bacterium]MBT4192953.1 hypothetical protein [Gammaproteobacteria bacterium]MBT4450894.1 hypothetical protein [Gammaproteobacteria bacterium]